MPRQYLRTLDIDFTNESDETVCDSCQPAKASKIYNCKSQKLAKYPYQFVHTDLVGPINPAGFGGERYFFTSPMTLPGIPRPVQGIRRAISSGA